MDVYFVRHGETTNNRTHTHQSPNTPLSALGREQAITAAEALRPLNPTLLIAGDYRRTKETARIIGNMLCLTPTISTLFHEVRRPASLYGTSHFSTKTFRYIVGSAIHRNQPAWHIEDAENFSDVKKRVDAALNLLESYSKKHKSVVVVSHTIFITFLTAYMCNARTMSLRVLIPHTANLTHMQNTEITHLKYTKSKSKTICPWMKISR